MDKPADPATPLAEVYQAFYADLAKEGTKTSTIDRYRYNIGRFEQWLIENGHPATLASLERTVLIAYRQHLETLPQQARGSIRRRRGGLMSRHTVHSYLRSIKCDLPLPPDHPPHGHRHGRAWRDATGRSATSNWPRLGRGAPPLWSPGRRASSAIARGAAVRAEGSSTGTDWVLGAAADASMASGAWGASTDAATTQASSATQSAERRETQGPLDAVLGLDGPRPIVVAPPVAVIALHIAATEVAKGRFYRMLREKSRATQLGRIS
jgi:hypothetical protein